MTTIRKSIENSIEELINLIVYGEGLSPEETRQMFNIPNNEDIFPLVNIKHGQGYYQVNLNNNSFKHFDKRKFLINDVNSVSRKRSDNFNFTHLFSPGYNYDPSGDNHGNRMYFYYIRANELCYASIKYEERIYIVPAYVFVRIDYPQEIEFSENFSFNDIKIRCSIRFDNDKNSFVITSDKIPYYSLDRSFKVLYDMKTYLASHDFNMLSTCKGLKKSKDVNYEFLDTREIFKKIANML